MASSQLMNNFEGDGASSSLIIPKIPNESKRQHLTDAIHHCFKLMLDNNLAVPTISGKTSMLAKLIGQEIFFRVVKMIYEIQFNVGKEVVDPPRADKRETSSTPASTGEIIEGIRVKREPRSPPLTPSLMVNESNLILKEGNYSPSEIEENMRTAELESDESIRNNGENRLEASSILAPTEDVLDESRIKDEPISPPGIYISFGDRDSFYSPSDDESLRTPLLFSVKEKAKAEELKPNQPVNEREDMMEASSALGLTEEVLSESRSRSVTPSPPSSMVEESDMSSTDEDSSYSPSEDMERKTCVPFSIKEKIVRTAELHPTWSYKSLKNISSYLRNARQLQQWKKEVIGSIGKKEKYKLISNWVLERAKKAKQDSKPVTSKLLQQWGKKASALYDVDGFKSSKGWVDRIKKELENLPS